MLNKMNAARTLAFLLVLALLACPKASYADRGRHHGGGHFYHYRDYPHFGLRLSVIPDGYFAMSVGGTRYYYFDGIYYERLGGDYVVVAPPVGAVVAKIPPEFQPVIINGDYSLIQ